MLPLFAWPEERATPEALIGATAVWLSLVDDGMEHAFMEGECRFDEFIYGLSYEEPLLWFGPTADDPKAWPSRRATGRRTPATDRCPIPRQTFCETGRPGGWPVAHAPG